MPICLFDIDGTLIDAGGSGESAMRCVLAEHFDLAEVSGDIPAAGRTDAAITTDLLTEHGIELARLGEFRDRYLEQLPKDLEANDGNVLPGVGSVLEKCRECDSVSLGLLTGNFEDAAWIKLSHFDLDGWFTFGAFGDRHVHRNDVARDALREIRDGVHRDQVRSPDDDIWIIGDTPADVECARAIRATAVAVATGVFTAEQLEATEPDFLLESFEDAHPFLEAVFSRNL